MTKHPEIYYYSHDESRTIFWSAEEQFDNHELIFIGSSPNPNKKMAVATFTQSMVGDSNWTIKEL